jgi:hypothetical protein
VTHSANPAITALIALGCWGAAGGPALLDEARQDGPWWQRAILAAGGVILLPLMWVLTVTIEGAPR